MYTHTHTYIYLYIYPKNCGCMKLRTFNKANSLVLNPTVEMNRETFHREAPTPQGEKRAYVKRALWTLISVCLAFFVVQATAQNNLSRRIRL